ncbi:MAG: NTP transferase domain-containing protein [Candidatus Hodarchaeota archaeon]
MYKRRPIIKAIILAAGEGKRLKKYTNKLPKGMLKFMGETLIEKQINLFKKIGISDIIIVKGYAQEMINYPDVKYYINEHYNSTNMLVSLFHAENEMDDDLIISYSDIMFELKLLEKLISSSYEISILVDVNWKKYWNMRYGSLDFDTESLEIDKSKIISIGSPNPKINKIDARYIGLLKFTKTGINQVKKIWHKYYDQYYNKPWQISGKTLKDAYITDILQALIENGYNVNAVKVNNGWIEFDTDKDYEKAILWSQTGKLKK